MQKPYNERRLDLRTAMDELPRGARKRLAEDLGVPQSEISKVLGGLEYKPLLLDRIERWVAEDLRETSADVHFPVDLDTV